MLVGDLGPFTPDAVDAVTAHMNADHGDDNLLIVRALGALPQATDAEMVGVGPEGAHFSATVGGAQREVLVPWSAPVRERPAIRREVVRMYQDACAVLGVEPRAAEGR